MNDQRAIPLWFCRVVARHVADGSETKVDLYDVEAATIGDAVDLAGKQAREYFHRYSTNFVISEMHVSLVRKPSGGGGHGGTPAIDRSSEGGAFAAADDRCGGHADEDRGPGNRG